MKSYTTQFKDVCTAHSTNANKQLNNTTYEWRNMLRLLGHTPPEVAYYNKLPKLLS